MRAGAWLGTIAQTNRGGDHRPTSNGNESMLRVIAHVFNRDRRISRKNGSRTHAATAGVELWDEAAKPCILTFSRFYLPGFRAGGPIRSISRLVECLGDEFQFRIVTADRDAGST